MFGPRSSCFCTRLRPGRLATCTKRQYLPAWRPFSLCCYSPTMTKPLDAGRPVRTSSTTMILSTVKWWIYLSYFAVPHPTHSSPSFGRPFRRWCSRVDDADTRARSRDTPISCVNKANERANGQIKKIQDKEVPREQARSYRSEVLAKRSSDTKGLSFQSRVNNCGEGREGRVIVISVISRDETISVARESYKRFDYYYYYLRFFLIEIILSINYYYTRCSLV